MPEFVSIRNADREMTDRYLSCLCAYKTRSCEFAYANLYAWEDAYDTKLCDCGSFFLIMFRISSGTACFMPPVGENADMKQYLSLVLQTAKQNGENEVGFSAFSKEEADRLCRIAPEVSFMPDRGNFDYLYEVEPLVTYSGKKLHSKRNHMNKFLSLYDGRYSFERITGKNAAECISFNREWSKINESYDTGSLGEEEKCAVTMLENFDAMGLCGGIMRVDGKVCGYTLAEETCPGSDTVVVHIEKALYDIEGVYPAMFSMFLASFGGKYKYVNREDDVNDDGLRKSKLSYNPVQFVEKYDGMLTL